jgi:hypothetical protein
MRSAFDLSIASPMMPSPMTAAPFASGAIPPIQSCIIGSPRMYLPRQNIRVGLSV